MDKKELVKKLLIVAIGIAVIGNILFVVESFKPLGDIVYQKIGVFGTFLGRVFAWITLIVDCLVIGTIGTVATFYFEEKFSKETK